MKLGTDMYKVSFKGNGYTGEEEVQNFLLKRCAELTIENGFTHFQIVGSGAGNDAGYMVNNVGNNAYISPVNRHTSTAVIKMLRNPAKGIAALDAETIFGAKKNSEKLPSSKEIDSLQE